MRAGTESAFKTDARGHAGIAAAAASDGDRIRRALAALPGAVRVILALVRGGSAHDPSALQRIVTLPGLRVADALLLAGERRRTTDGDAGNARAIAVAGLAAVAAGVVVAGHANGSVRPIRGALGRVANATGIGRITGALFDADPVDHAPTRLELMAATRDGIALAVGACEAVITVDGLAGADAADALIARCAGVAIIARRAVGLCRIAADAGGWIAGAGIVTLIEWRADDRIPSDAVAGSVARVVPGAGVAIVTGRSGSKRGRKTRMGRLIADNVIALVALSGAIGVAAAAIGRETGAAAFPGSRRTRAVAPSGAVLRSARSRATVSVLPADFSEAAASRRAGLV